ncbi:hypothetical protein [Anaerostipes sp.]|uniref:hypothetical protein n=1 Tax=Anaerostipes sp. TaxID=1872530 RepID=UPI0025C0E28B|nr:hypothetical protein [Anaerostipes sp.]MBS7009303.1 hypothetical protein [Anaerostipes sp.]
MEKLKKRNEGSALIFVMCILCVFMAVALIMILVSYQVLTNAQQSAVKDQCRISAVSFNKILEKEITSPEGQGTSDDNIRYFLYDQIKNDKWVYYNEKEEGHGEKEAFRTLDIDMIQSAKDTLGEIQVTMYWESEKDAPADQTVLVTKVSSSSRKQEYHITTRYSLKISTDDPEQWTWAVKWQE